MFMLKCALHIVNRSIRHSTAFEDVQPLLGRLLLRKRLD